MLIKVVIVEDEMLVRLGMKMCLDGYSSEMKVVAAFGAAEEAEAYLEKNSVDVLITDIRLTGMTGLDLIKRIRVKCSNMLTLVVSCYEDFSYARESMELGVDKYFLKNELTEDELPQKVIDLYKKKHMKFSHTMNPTTSIENITSNEISAGKYQIAYIVLRGKGDKKNSGPDDVNLEMLVEILQRILNIYGMGECFLRHNIEVFCILYFAETDTKEDIRNKGWEFFQNASVNIQNYFNKNLFFAISDIFLDLSKVDEKYKQVKEWSQYTFYYECPQMIKVISNMENKNSTNTLTLLYENILTNSWLLQMQNIIKKYFHAKKVEYSPVEEVKLQVVKFVTDLKIYLEKNIYTQDLDDLFDKENIPNYINVNQFDSSECLMEWTMMFLQTVFNNIVNRDNTIKKVEVYLEENYHRDLSLTEIAETFHMNSVYFCQYFKKQKGVTFVHYLNQLRIEKAKQLLHSTDDTVEMIAEKVGIFNTNYFFRLFKKVTGITIGTFRKNR